MPGTADVDRIQIILLDQSIEVGINKGLTRIRTPVSQQPRLDVLQSQRLAQQRVGLEVEHPQLQKQARSPIRVDAPQLGRSERGSLDRRTRGAVGRDIAFRAQRLIGSGASAHFLMPLIRVADNAERF
jgi:hypothetical protein